MMDSTFILMRRDNSDEKVEGLDEFVGVHICAHESAEDSPEASGLFER